MARIYAVSLIFVVLLAGCGDDDGNGGPYTYQVEEPETKTWPATGVTKLVVSTENGAVAVAVTGADPISADIVRSCKGTDEADAQAHVDDITVTDTLAGDTLTIVAEMPDDAKRSYSASFDIEAPVLEHMDLDTENGQISVSDHEGSIDADVANGEIACDLAALPAAGWARLRAGNGGVTLSVPGDVSASFDIQTGVGTVTVIGLTATYTTDEAAHKAGTLGAGEAEITITVEVGDITIQAR
jgi:hypothetical protein